MATKKNSIGVPPNNIELEVAVLGVLLQEPENYKQVTEIVKTYEVFYDLRHQEIYKAIQHLAKNARNVDLFTVSDTLRANGVFDTIGGLPALMKLLNSVGTSAHVITHSQLIVEKFIQREMIKTCQNTIGKIFENEDDIFTIIEQHDKTVTAIESENIIAANAAVPVGELYMDMLMQAEEMKMKGTALIGMDTGYHELNHITAGFSGGDFIILAARPSQGKTALMLNFCVNACLSPISQCGECYVYSLETGAESLIRRMAASKANVPLADIISGHISPNHQRQLESEVVAFNKLPIYIDDTTKRLNDIVKDITRKFRKYCKTQKAKDGLPMLVTIDYLQLIVHKIQGSNREGIVSDISRTLKILSIELKLPNNKPGVSILALCQVNRGTEDKADKRPELSSLRESGALEQDAQKALLLWHQKTGDKDNKGNDIVNTFVIVAKNKDGKCGDVKLQFNGDIQRWMNYEETYHYAPASNVTYQFQPPSDKQDDWEQF